MPIIDNRKVLVKKTGFRLALAAIHICMDK